MSLASDEFAVQKALVSYSREPLSRDKLMHLARGREYSAMECSSSLQTYRLRRMIEEDPSNTRYIQTAWVWLRFCSRWQVVMHEMIVLSRCSSLACSPLLIITLVIVSVVVIYLVVLGLAILAGM